VTRRETIFIASAIVGLLGAIGYSLMDSPSAPAPSPTPEPATVDLSSNPFAAEQAQDGTGWNLSVIRAAGEAWGENPFSMTAGGTENTLPPGFESWEYTGFIQIGETRIGIINGLEMTAGMKMDGSNYEVRFINAQEARLINPLTGTSITLHMEQEP
jgi:hypothetical protein